MGAGPSNVHPRVLQAMSSSLLGHLDPNFLAVMDDVRSALRYTFRTENPVTLPISGTGTAGMEAAMVNILEPGDGFVMGVNGYFGERLSEIARRCGASVVTVEHELGMPVEPERLREVIAATPNVKAVGVVHAETSTGTLTSLPEISRIAHDAGALLVVDAVTSLGGVEPTGGRVEHRRLLQLHAEVRWRSSRPRSPDAEPPRRGHYAVAHEQGAELLSGPL